MTRGTIITRTVKGAHAGSEKEGPNGGGQPGPAQSSALKRTIDYPVPILIGLWKGNSLAKRRGSGRSHGNKHNRAFGGGPLGFDCRVVLGCIHRPEVETPGGLPLAA
jgi:hypothetical protein